MRRTTVLPPLGLLLGWVPLTASWWNPSAIPATMTRARCVPTKPKHHHTKTTSIRQRRPPTTLWQSDGGGSDDDGNDRGAGGSSFVEEEEEHERSRPSLRPREDPSVSLKDLLRDHRVSRLEGGPLVEDEVEGDRLPDLFSVGRRGDGRYSGDSAGGPSSPVKPLLREVRRRATEPSNGMDYFDYGLGGLVKLSVYGFIVLAILWELYLNSPFFERALPPAPIVF
ncbi:unnamed protein product [Phaeothamnion confervicola]